MKYLLLLTALCAFAKLAHGQKLTMNGVDYYLPTEKQVKSWEKGTTLVKGLNTKLTRVNDSTLQVDMAFDEMNTYERDRLTNVPNQKIIINTDTNAINIFIKRLNKWAVLWQSL